MIHCCTCTAVAISRSYIRALLLLLLLLCSMPPAGAVPWGSGGTTTRTKMGGRPHLNLEIRYVANMNHHRGSHKAPCPTVYGCISLTSVYASSRLLMACQLEVTTGRPHTSGRVDTALAQTALLAVATERRRPVRASLSLLLLLLLLLMAIAVFLREAPRTAPGVAHRRQAMPERCIIVSWW